MEKKDNYHLIYDLLQGDMSVPDRGDFEDLSIEDIQEAISLIKGNANLNQFKLDHMLDNLWRVNYTSKPPVIEEFLTEEWIGPTANNLYSHVRDTLTEFYNPSKKYKSLYLSSCISYGKSTISAISILYILVHTFLLRNSKRYYNIAESSSIVAVLGSFTLKKSKQLLLKPFLNILQSSPKFRRVRQEERLMIALKETPDKIPWTTASSMESALQFAKDLHILCVSDTASLLGLSILTGALSELSFWVDRGVSHEEISRMVNDLESRIFSRFSDNYFARFIIDSSPNSFESPIDKYVFSGEAEQEEKNLVVKSSHWELKDFHWKYPKWIKTGKSFPVFRGSAGKPTFEIAETQIKDFHPDEILTVPIDLHAQYVKSPEKIIKDYGGYPSSGVDKLISNYGIIDDMFDTNLKNIEYGIKAQANRNPKRLIWDQIVDLFFIRINERYKFYRNALEARYIHVDLSEVNDSSAISCCHPELTKEGEIIYILDFTIAIIPDKNRINLDAISEFIFDLRRLGHMNLKLVTFDQYQSSSIIQRFNRENITSKRLSVDSSTAPYNLLISRLKDHKIKCGPNVIIRNNIKSLMEIRTDKGRLKIEHTKGKLVNTYNGDFKNSLCGINSKDLSDAVAGSVFNAINNHTGVPRYIYNPKILKSEDEILTNILNKYSLVPTY